MNFKKIFILFLIALLELSCSGSKKTQYKDTNYLEMPPRMTIDEQPERVIEINGKVDKGLGDSVSLVEAENQSIIKIKKTFERSWELVEQALKLNETKITDKDRDLGVVYVTYDPDDQSSENLTLLDRMTFSFFNDEYDEANYKLTIIWRESDTEVTAEMVDSENNEILNDVEWSNKVGSKLLLKALYKTIKNDLPVN